MPETQPPATQPPATQPPRSLTSPPARPRAALAGITPYVSGKAAPSRPGALRLASNENPLGPSPRAVEAIVATAAALSRYPDSHATQLKTALAARFELTPVHVLLGSGSDDVIHLLASAYLEPARTVVLADPPYGILRIAAQASGATVHQIPLRDHLHDLDAMAAAARPGGWVCVTNPHNPTGTAVAPAALRRFVDAVPADCLIVLDEAYHDFMEEPYRLSGVELLAGHPNLVVLRTFSKAYGLAGLRVGYALADPALLEPVERVRPPFNVGILAQAGALAALDDRQHVERTVASNAQARRLVQDACARLGLQAIPSQANFVLIRGGKAGAYDAVDAGSRGGWPEALAREGIVIRPGENLGMPGWYRMTLGTPADMERVMEIVAAAM